MNNWAVLGVSVALSACGDMWERIYLPDRPGWTSQLDCYTEIGTLHFERAPAAGCVVIENQYIPLAHEIWRPVSPQGAKGFSTMEIWVFDLDTTEQAPFDRTDFRRGAESITWMDRCLSGLAHEELHYYEVQYLATAPWVSGRHWRWESDETWALADRRWYGQTKAICGVLSP